MVWLDLIIDKLPGPMRLRVRGCSMLPTLRPGDEVVVQPVTAEALIPGDWVVVRGAQGAFLHRYLGRRHGRILTKGDGHMGFDPLWPPDAVLGRVVEAQRDGRCFYRRAAGQLRRERLFTAGHHVLGDVWGVLRRVRALLLALVAMTFALTVVWAAVTLISFTAKSSTDCGDDIEVCVVLDWATASETDNLGFRLWRSLTEGDGYVDISGPGFIGSLDEGAGASYVVTDTNVIPGTIYYYKLQDLPADGTLNSFTKPISATVPLTPTLTPTPTATSTPTPTPSPSPTPNSNVRFWADKTDLTAGECAVLYWQTNNITAIFFDNMAVSGDDQRQFCPCSTESHVLRVKYRDGRTEDFTITLNVTGQCGTMTPTTTLTPTPRATTPVPTWTLPPTSAPGAALTQAAVTATATLAPVSVPESGRGAQATATQIVPESAASTVPLFVTDALPANPLPSLGTPLPDPGSTRSPVSGSPLGVTVEDMLSAWLLIVGGIVGAGLIGAGILMWKRQQ